MDTNGKYYLGRVFDPQQNKLTDQPLLYDPADLTTHAVVVGMTGSGKTGLCIGLLEEAALNGVPALMIDPKGDMTNTLLHFPDLLPADFQPWINADQARRDGKTVEQAAVEASALWRNGLADWEIGPERVLALKNAAHFAVYTPGSDAGIPISILATLKAPAIPWEANREILREKISSMATALLGLVGLTDVDPVRSREHILLANIFEYAWSKGKDLDLTELILQTQNPPFQKLGVFDVNTFFPERDRFELAMLLNNILAAPAFQTWIEGTPLDIPSLLYGTDGRPRHSVFYIAHLGDAERMFFVTLLYSAVETWMRTQTGTPGLRAILYFDEIFGYIPPVSNPPSKQPMMRMLKQARAFGVGQILVTQNPVDVDYKGLSNAGTWMIGKLQTDQDKQRLLDGLDSAMSGGLDRSQYDRLISTLGKRIFLLHNVHAKGPQLFGTRWAMNYLTGPLTRTQIPALNRLAGAQAGPGPTMSTAAQSPATPLDQFQPVPIVPDSDTQPVPVSPVSPVSASTVPPGDDKSAAAGMGSATRQAVPTGVMEYFLPNNLTFTQAFEAGGRSFPPEAISLGILYRPVLLAQANARFVNRKYNLDYELYRTVLVPAPDRRGLVRWEDYASDPIKPQSLRAQADPRARYATLEAPLSDAKAMTALQKDFVEWVYRSSQVTVRANETLKQFAGPQISVADFRKQCADAARQGRDAELKKVSASFETRLRSLKDKLTREARELKQDESELSQRRVEEGTTHLENVASLFGIGSKRRLTTSMTRRRLTSQAKADVEESQDAIEEFQKQLATLEAEKAAASQEINDRWGEVANQLTEIPITPLKKEILLDFCGVAWMPFQLVKIGERIEELPGFRTTG